ncbi:MAG: hypothetical protein AAFX05_07190 [Planctomycetota bacterium]
MDHDVAKSIRHAVAATNRGLVLRGVIAIVMGLATCAVLVCVIMLVSWFVVGLNIALAIAGVFVLIGFWSAWRRVDPLASAGPMSTQQMALTQWSTANPNFFYVSPKHAVAGSAAAIIDGPANVLEGVSLLRRRIRTGGGTIDGAARLLSVIGSGVPARTVPEAAAAALLCRIGFAKLRDQECEVWLTTTQKGRDAAGA